MNPRLTLIAACLAAAFAGAAAVHVLDLSGVINPHAIAEIDPVGVAPATERESGATSEAALIPLQPSLIETGSIADRDGDYDAASARLAFVTPGALPLRLTSLVDEPAGDIVDEWTTEEHVETAPQPALRITIKRPETFPWRNLPPLTAQSRRTLNERLSEISPGATQRLVEKFAAAKTAWPPAAVSLVAIKDAKALELHARAPDGTATFIHRYRILAASGKAGPKLIQGDKQVPEGVYGISYLNPNSQFHVALRVNYPNAFDREMAKKDGRKKLGGDIMIHGKALSAGCLAVGDEAAEELFVLAAKVGLPNVKLVIAPADFRRDGVPLAKPGDPVWLPKLYADVASALADTKAPPAPSPATGLLSLFGN